MKVNKKERYKKNSYAAEHTLMIRCDSLDEQKAAENTIVKSASRRKTRGQDAYHYNAIVNPNRAINSKTMIKSYSEMKAILDKALQDIHAENVSIIRADMSINSDCCEDYALFQKAHRFLLAMLADAYSIDNCYCSTDLFTLESLNTAIKGAGIEAENYNKDLEAKGTTDAKNRLELRSLCIHGDMQQEFTLRWSKRLDTALRSFQAVQNRYNQTLIKIWSEDAKKEPRDRNFQSFTVFLIRYRDFIFTRQQLIDLFVLIGNNEKSAQNCAKHFKDRHAIEFFSLSDMQFIIKTIKNCIQTYFAT